MYVLRSREKRLLRGSSISTYSYMDDLDVGQAKKRKEGFVVSCINHTTPKVPSAFPASNSFLRQSILYTDLSKAKFDRWFPILGMINSDPSVGIQGLCHPKPPPTHPVPVPAVSPRQGMNTQKAMLPHASMSFA